MKSKEKDIHELTKQGYIWHTHSWLVVINNKLEPHHTVKSQK